MDIESCPVKAAIDVIGGKWKPLILYHLKGGSLRFGVLLRRIPQGSRKVLTEQLRQLAAEGIVGRRLYSGRVLHTEYFLTDYGETLRPILSSLASWGKKHKQRQLNKEASQTKVSFESQAVGDDSRKSALE